MKKLVIVITLAITVLSCKHQNEMVLPEQPQYLLTYSSWSIDDAPMPIEDMVLNSLDSEEEEIDQIMLVWAKALLVMYCESNFIEEFLEQLDQTGGVLAENLINSNPSYYAITDSIFALNGLSWL